jgi:choline monooxygenase
MVNKNKSLPSHFYYDHNIYEKEKRDILYRNWHYVGHESQVKKPGDYLTFQLGDENLIIIRGNNDQLKGFFNVCRHRAHKLLENNGSVKSITCPYHAWNYSRDGTLQYARNSEKMTDFDKSEYCLTNFQVITICDFIFVNLDKNASTLIEQAGEFEKDLRKNIPFLDRLKPLPNDTSRPSSINANWKIVVDNFLECYHCTKAHPAFVDLIDMEHYKIEIYDIWSRQYASSSRPKNNAYEFDINATIKDMCFWYLWPTTALGYLPGVEALFFSSILPISINKTTRVGHWLVADGAELPKIFSDYMNDILFMEDIALCESVQRGLQSQSYHQGPFMIDPDHSGISEIAVQHFHGLIEKALNND